MAAQILEFKPIIAYLKNPYLKNVRYFFKFSSTQTIIDLNNLDRVLIRSHGEWIAVFGKNLDGVELSYELLTNLDVVTSEVLFQLEKDWNESLKLNETIESRFEIIDDFISTYGINL